MKKTFVLGLIFSSAVLLGTALETKAAVSTAASSADQFWDDRRRGHNDRRGRYDRYDRRDRRDDRRYDDRRWNRGRPYSYVTTRIVRRWFNTYRETIRVTHLPNGRTKTQVIRRVRIR